MALDLQEEFETLVRAQLARFIEWVGKHWVVGEADRIDDYFGDKSSDWIDGYNAALEGLGGAIECWMENA